MKKTLVALAVAAMAATSANAATVYEQDGTKVGVSGSVRLILKKQKNKRTDLENNGSRITFDVAQDLGHGFSGIGQLQIRPSGTNFDKGITTARLWAGFKQEGIGKVTFGRQLTVGDEIGQSDFTYNFGGINTVTDSGDKVVHFRSESFAGFSFGADYIFGNADKTKEADVKYKDGSSVKDTQGKVARGMAKTTNNRGYVLGALYNNKFGNFGIDAAVGYSNDIRNTEARLNSNNNSSGVFAEGKYKEEGFTSGFKVSYDKFAVGVDYSQRETNDKKRGTTFRITKLDDGGKAVDTKYHKVQEFELGLKYQILEASKVYGEVMLGKAKALNEKDTKFAGFVLGADYKLHKNVVTYLEGMTIKGKQDGKTIHKNNAVNVGLRVFF